jgi:hypothetical protein
MLSALIAASTGSTRANSSFSMGTTSFAIQMIQPVREGKKEQEERYTKTEIEKARRKIESQKDSES